LDLQSTGNEERKRALELDLVTKLVTLRPFFSSPFWEDIHIHGGRAFRRDCTLADAIEAFLATIQDLIAGAERGECTTAGLHFGVECVEDLVAAYGLTDPWKTELYDITRRLDTITISPEGAAALVRRTIPQLRERLADERRRSE
jgi:hypothetical protein